jgi:hypothetical protein
MTEAQVLDILGPPIEQWGPNSDDPKEGYSKTYGIVVHSSEKVPKDLAFVLWFRNGKVFGKDDPFNGVFSTDGKPTIPVLIYPRNGQVFDHYPRIVDFRWYPSSGKYPMRYEVQAMGKEWSDQGQGTKNYTYRVAEPHYVRSLGGAGDWRWRVKAVNDLGESEWSEFWHLKSKK